MQLSSNLPQDYSYTRAGVITNLGDFNTQGSFGVFGYKDGWLSTDNLVIFNNQKVEYDKDATPTTWDYSPTKFWDKRADCYYFAAYAPHTSDMKANVTNQNPAWSNVEASLTATGDDKDKVMNITGIPNWQLVNYYDPAIKSGTDKETGNVDAETLCYDLMTGHSNGVPAYYLLAREAVGTTPAHVSGAVDLTFSHALSQLVLKLSYPSMPTSEDFLYEYYVTKVELGRAEDLTATPAISGQEVPLISKTSSFEGYKYVAPTKVGQENEMASGDKYGDVTYLKGTFNTNDKGSITLFPTSESASGVKVKVESNKNPETGLNDCDFDKVLCTYLSVPFSVENGLYFNITYDEVKWKSVDAKKKKLTGSENVTIQSKESGFVMAVVSEEGEPKFELESGNIYTIHIHFDKGKVINVLKVYVNPWSTSTMPGHEVYNW